MLNDEPFYSFGPIETLPPGGGGGGTGGGGVPTSPPATSQNGGPASTIAGSNGGYADDGPPLFPRPADVELGTEMIEGGGFTDPADLTGWRNRDGSPLGPEWGLVDGRLHCRAAQGVYTAYYFGARRSTPHMPYPRYTFDTSADLQCDPNVQARFGVAWGNWNVGELPSYVEASDAATYAEETTVTHSWSQDEYNNNVGAGFVGQYSVLNVMPCVQFIIEGATANGYADNVSMEISKESPAVTEQVLTNGDFSAGLTNWSLFPDPADTNPYVPDVSASGGVVTVDFHSNYGPMRWLIHDDPLPDADAIAKYVQAIAEYWSNDTTVLTGNNGVAYTVNGVTFGLAYKYPGGNIALMPAGRMERGDFTEKEMWARVNVDIASGVTVHAAWQFSGRPGFTAKLRNPSYYVTDAVGSP